MLHSSVDAYGNRRPYRRLATRQDQQSPRVCARMVITTFSSRSRAFMGRGCAISFDEGPKSRAFAGRVKRKREIGVIAVKKIGALLLILVLAGCSSAAQPDQTTSQTDPLKPPPTQTRPGEHKRRMLITTDNPYMLPPETLKRMETGAGGY